MEIRKNNSLLGKLSLLSVLENNVFNFLIFNKQTSFLEEQNIVRISAIADFLRYKNKRNEKIHSSLEGLAKKGFITFARIGHGVIEYNFLVNVFADSANAFYKEDICISRKLATKFSFCLYSYLKRYGYCVNSAAHRDIGAIMDVIYIKPSPDTTARAPRNVKMFLEYLKKAKHEINSKSDVLFSYELLKNKINKCSKIRFISHQTSPKTYPQVTHKTVC
jgi:hypothetical protein